MESSIIELGQIPLDLALLAGTSNSNGPDMVFSGTIDGRLMAHDLNTRKRLFDLHIYDSSCRALTLQDNQAILLAASKDGDIKYLDIETQTCIGTYEDAHDYAVSRLCTISENMFASGDDEGVVKLWDRRKPTSIRQWQENEDFIADLSYVPDKKTLLVAGGDGYLTVLDIRKPDLIARSDNMESDILCLDVVKEGRKVVCGFQDGVLGLFSWGDWGDMSDRFVGHPASIDTLVALTDEIVLTGSADGLVRAMSILPNKFLGIVGDAGEGYPVERMRVSDGGKWLVCCSHDDRVRFWDIENAFEDGSDDDEAVEEENDLSSIIIDEDADTIETGSDDSSESDSGEDAAQPLAKKQKPNNTKRRPKIQSMTASFFDGLEASDSDESD